MLSKFIRKHLSGYEYYDSEKKKVYVEKQVWFCSYTLIKNYPKVVSKGNMVASWVKLYTAVVDHTYHSFIVFLQGWTRPTMCVLKKGLVCRSSFGSSVTLVFLDYQYFPFNGRFEENHPLKIVFNKVLNRSESYMTIVIEISIGKTGYVLFVDLRKEEFTVLVNFGP